MHLKNVIGLLSKHKAITAALVLLYAAFMLLAHNTFVNLSIEIMNSFTLPVYNQVVKKVGLIIGFILLVTILFGLYKNRSHFSSKLLYLATTIVFIGLHASFMFEMNIEIIHSFEYSVLAVLLFALTGRVGAAIIFSLPVMILDEWVQYKILYPDYTQYYELNDILMDVFGAALILIVFWVMGIIESKSTEKIFKTPELKFLLTVLIFTVIAFSTGLFATHQSTAGIHTVFVFSRLPSPDMFWRVHDFTKATYHVLTPIEGVFVISSACLFYTGPDAKTNER